jgi:predicted small metal-binding protein
MSRKTMDCRDFPSDSKCTLTISGEEEEVLRAAAMHAVDVHGHRDTPEFRNELRKSLKPEAQAGRR